jgi:hypothetical protein
METAATSSGQIHSGVTASDRAVIALGFPRVPAVGDALVPTTHDFRWDVSDPMFNAPHVLVMERTREFRTGLHPTPAGRACAAGQRAAAGHARLVRLAPPGNARELRWNPGTWCACSWLAANPSAATPRDLFPVAGRVNDRPATGLFMPRLGVDGKPVRTLCGLLDEWAARVIVRPAFHTVTTSTRSHLA